MSAFAVGPVTIEVKAPPSQVFRRSTYTAAPSTRLGEPELWPGSWFSRHTPSIRLANPERWTEFLDGPVVMGPRVAG